MSKVIQEEEINEIVQTIISDFDGSKNIDAVNLFNKPDKAEVIELVNNLIRVIYPIKSIIPTIHLRLISKMLFIILTSRLLLHWNSRKPITR